MANRRSEIREQHEITFLLVEGITEAVYFNNLKENDFSIKNYKLVNLKGKIQDMKNSIDEKMKLGFSSTKFILVFDADVLKDTNGIKYKTIEKLKSKKYIDKIVFGDSLPCFEFWLCLHLENKRISDKSELFQFLDKQVDYAKDKSNIKDVIDKILDKNNQNIEKAIERAKKYRNDDFSCNSYTNIPDAIEALRNPSQ